MKKQYSYESWLGLRVRAENAQLLVMQRKSKITLIGSIEAGFTYVKHKANDVLKLCYLLMFLEVSFLS